VTCPKREFAINKLLVALAIAGVVPAAACGSVSSAGSGTGGGAGGV